MIEELTQEERINLVLKVMRNAHRPMLVMPDGRWAYLPPDLDLDAALKLLRDQA